MSASKTSSTPQGRPAVRRAAVLSILTSIATLALKFTAYFLTGSVSLLSDALEAFVNLAAGLLALGAVLLAARPADDRHAYGHDKVEYFSSGAEGALILVAAASIVFSAVSRVMAPHPLERLGPGILVAIVAAGMNLATARIMLRVARQHDSITIEADAHHLLSDVWTSVGVVAGLALVMAYPAWSWLDPLIAIAVGIRIVFTGIALLRRSVEGLMDTALPHAELARIDTIIRARLPADADFHDLRTRKAGARRFIELHLTLPGAMSVAQSHAICDAIESDLGAALDHSVVTIHVEPAEQLRREVAALAS